MNTWSIEHAPADYACASSVFLKYDIDTIFSPEQRLLLFRSAIEAQTMGLLGIIYVGLRSFGKFTGAWLGGMLGRAEPAVRDNLGLGLRLSVRRSARIGPHCKMLETMSHNNTIIG